MQTIAKECTEYISDIALANSLRFATTDGIVYDLICCVITLWSSKMCVSFKMKIGHYVLREIEHCVIWIKHFFYYRLMDTKYTKLWAPYYSLKACAYFELSKYV